MKLDSEADYFVQAQAAIATGDTTKALDLLSKSIETTPQAYSYFQRARIYVDQNKDAEAISDCEEGLKLEPNHVELKWLLGELKKPKSGRFKGKFKDPPRAIK